MELFDICKGFFSPLWHKLKKKVLLHPTKVTCPPFWEPLLYMWYKLEYDQFSISPLFINKLKNYSCISINRLDKNKFSTDFYYFYYYLSFLSFMLVWMPLKKSTKCDFVLYLIIIKKLVSAKCRCIRCCCLFSGLSSEPTFFHNPAHTQLVQDHMNGHTVVISTMAAAHTPQIGKTNLTHKKLHAVTWTRQHTLSCVPGFFFTLYICTQMFLWIVKKSFLI